MKRVSVIIVTHNSEHDIFDCLRSLKRHADIPLEQLEVIIVDNRSRETDAMFMRIRELWGEDIVFIRNDRNGGYGEGNNIGIKAAKAPLLMIMNPDVRIYEPVFSRALLAFGQRPDLGILGMTQMFSETRKSYHSMHPLLTVNGYFAAFLNVICNRLGLFLPSWMYIQGSCFFLRRDYIMQIGMFDEDNFMYGEEEDIHCRLREAFGLSVFGFDKSLHYIHLTEARRPSAEYMQRLAETNIRLYEKKGVRVRPIVSNMLRNNRILLFRQRLFYADRELLELLLSHHRHLLNLLHRYE